MKITIVRGNGTDVSARMMALLRARSPSVVPCRELASYMRRPDEDAVKGLVSRLRRRLGAGEQIEFVPASTRGYRLLRAA